MTKREGYAVVWNRLLQNTDVSAPARLLYALLDGLPPEKGARDDAKLATYPQLAGMLGVSVSTAQRLIRELGRAGWIAWTSGGRGGRRGSGRPNRYLLLDVVPRSRSGSHRPAQLEREPSAVEVAVGAGEPPSTGRVVDAADEPAEREDHGGVVEAEPGHRTRVGAASAARGTADPHRDGGGIGIGIAWHDRLEPSGSGHTEHLTAGGAIGPDTAHRFERVHAEQDRSRGGAR